VREQFRQQDAPRVDLKLTFDWKGRIPLPRKWHVEWRLHHQAPRPFLGKQTERGETDDLNLVIVASMVRRQKKRGPSSRTLAISG
jgi:hypothetical protein